jgi:hypothetical protein
MSTIVGSLQVDVTTGQATLTFDSAKKELDSLADKAEGSSQRLDYSMRESRESIMLTGDALGIHLPAGITRAIAGIDGLGQALATAMPYVAVVAGIVLIVEALEKMHAAEEKTKIASENAGSAMTESLRGLDDKFLQAGIKADELAGNHFAALQKQIKLINNETLGDLEHEFEGLGKIADSVFDGLKSHWYTLGSGSQHATYNLNEYEAKYRQLLETKGEPAANAYLQEQIKYEQQILDLQEKVIAMKGKIDTDAKEAEYQAIILQLKQAGSGATQKEHESQRKLVDTLNTQVTAQEKINATKTLDVSTATGEDAKKEAEKKLASWEQNFKAAMKYKGAVAEANLEEAKRSGVDTSKATEREAESTKQWAEYLSKVAKSSHDVAEAQEKLNEAQATNKLDTQMAGYESQVEAIKSRVAMGIESERQGAAQLIAIYKQEENAKLSSMTQGIKDQEQAVIAATSRLAQAEETGDVLAVNAAQISYDKELQAFQDMENKKVQAATLFQKKIADENNAMLSQSMQVFKEFETSFASSVGKTIVEGKNFGMEMRHVAIQFLENMISSNIKWLISSITTNQARVASGQAADAEATASSLGHSAVLRFDAAKTAAAKAMTTVPFPLDLVVAPLVFAAALAFAEGGIVPGTGYGDSIPAMLTPGEAVLPKPMVEKLSASSEQSSGPTIHMHYSPTNNVKAWDGSDVKDAMDQHRNEFMKQAQKEMRRRHQ